MTKANRKGRDLRSSLREVLPLTAKIPPPASAATLAEIVRMLGLHLDLSSHGPRATRGSAAVTGGAGVEPFVQAAANLPAEVFQLLSNLYPEGAPEDVLSIFQAPYETASRSKPYFATSDRAVSQSRGIAQLMAAVDRGSMSVEQFNVILATAAIDESTFKRALLELQREPDLDAVRLCDTVYRLFGGELDPFILRARSLGE